MPTAVDAGDGDHGRTAGAHPVPDADPGPGARLCLGRPAATADGTALGATATRLARWTRAPDRGLQHGSRRVRPVDRHVQPDRLDGTGPRERERDPAPTTAASCSPAATTARPPAPTGPGRQPSCTTRRRARSARPARCTRRARTRRRRCSPTVACSSPEALTGPSPAAMTSITLASYRARRDRLWLPRDRRDLRPDHGDIQQDRLDERAPPWPHGDPAPGRPRPRRRQRRREQPQQQGGRPVRPGDRPVEPGRAR